MTCQATANANWGCYRCIIYRESCRRFHGTGSWAYRRLGTPISFVYQGVIAKLWKNYRVGGSPKGADRVTRRLLSVNHSQLWNTPTSCGWHDSTHHHLEWLKRDNDAWRSPECDDSVGATCRFCVFFGTCSFSTERLFHAQLSGISANHDRRFVVCWRMKKGRTCQGASFCMGFLWAKWAFVTRTQVPMKSISPSASVLFKVHGIKCTLVRIRSAT